MGIVLALLMAFVYQPSVKEALVLMIPMMVDGFAQSLTEYESRNFRRLITGVLFGIGLITLFLRSTVYAFEVGRIWGLTHFGG